MVDGKVACSVAETVDSTADAKDCGSAEWRVDPRVSTLALVLVVSTECL